jgi:hypothetical protein
MIQATQLREDGFINVDLQRNSATLMQLAIIAVLAQTIANAQPGETTTATAQGSVCIAAVAPPTPGEKSLANPAGGNLVKVYSVKIDDLQPVRTLSDRGVAAPPLSLSDKHVVRIFGDGKQVESFRFSFGDYSTNELCLLFDELYLTWSLRNCEDAGAGAGRCRPRHRLPWVEVKSCAVVGTRGVPVRLGPPDMAVQYYTDYQIRYVAEGREFVKYAGSGLPPSLQEPSAGFLRALPKDCRYTIRYHPGMPDKAEVSPR